MARLLLLSRDLKIQSALVSAIGIGFNVSIDSSQERVKRLAMDKRCELIVVDLEGYPPDAQFDFLAELEDLGMPVVVVTDDDAGKRSELARRGMRYCLKPLAIPELAILIRATHEHAIAKHSAECPVMQGQSDPYRLVGSSAGTAAVHDLIRRVAPANAFVLITGESGTGKELIARAIHSASARAKHRFIAVSCGAIPESLIESELFGCEKGAFTGALSRRIGYFEDAGEGTLLLDEIGELSHHTQVKLLRVLQQREFTRLGSSSAIPLRARILFATNRNLKQMVEEGTFREDLYYRVNVIGIHSPPLRERREDIPRLAEHFLVRYSPGHPKAISPEAMALLREHTWPGNIRELENVIQSAIVLSDDDTIRASNLPRELDQNGAAPLIDARWLSFEEQLRDYKVKLAMEAVRECNGNKTLAAQSLDISRTYLHRLIREPDEEGPALRVA